MATPNSSKESKPPPAPVSVAPPSPHRSLHASPGASTPTSKAARRLAIAVDLSDESAYAVRWAVQNYLRPGDAVILLHVGPTSVLYGADWGFIDLSAQASGAEENQKKKMDEDLDAFTAAKARDVAAPLVEAGIPFKIHIVKDHDMKERLCLEVERLGLSTMILGSRGVGSATGSKKSGVQRQRQSRSEENHVEHDDGGGSRLGSVSDYCVRHCGCPVVVVRYPEEGKEGSGSAVEEVFHDASSKQSDIDKMS